MRRWPNVVRSSLRALLKPRAQFVDFMLSIESIMLVDMGQPLATSFSFSTTSFINPKLTAQSIIIAIKRLGKSIYSGGREYKPYPSQHCCSVRTLATTPDCDGRVDAGSASVYSLQESLHRGRHLTNLSTLPIRAFLLFILRLQQVPDHLPGALP